jgi:hypothetical protein
MAAKKKRSSPSSDYVAAIKEHTKALRHHAKAMNSFAKAITNSAPVTDITALQSHTNALNSFVTFSTAFASGKAISRDTIRRRLAQKWGKPQSSVKEADPIGNYIKGGPGVMAAYADELNHSTEFSPDGLNLQTNDTSFVTTVGELINAIATWYTNNHWHVTQ